MQIGIPVDEALLAEIDSLATLMGSPWHKPTRAEVARIGLAIGIGALKAQASAMVSALAAATAPPLHANAASAYSAFPFTSAQNVAPPMDSNPMTPTTVGMSREASEEQGPALEEGERDSARDDGGATSRATEPSPHEASSSASPRDLNPERLRTRLNKALAGGTVKVKDLAEEMSVVVSYLYGFKVGKPMSSRKLQELDEALARREAPSTLKARTLIAKGLRRRLNRAVSSGIKVKELAEQAGINKASVYSFNAGAAMGKPKLEALDRVLTKFELSSAQPNPPSLSLERPRIAAQVQPSPSRDETSSIEAEKAATESASVVANPAQVQAKLVKAIAEGASVQVLAQETGIAATYIGTFKYNGKMGKEKLQTLDEALTKREQGLEGSSSLTMQDNPDAQDANGTRKQQSVDAPPIPLGTSLRNRRNVTLTHRTDLETAPSMSQPARQPPRSEPLTPDEIAEGVFEALADPHTVLTLPQLQHHIHEPAASLAPVLARLIAEHRLGVTEVGGVAAYKLLRLQLSLDDMLKK